MQWAVLFRYLLKLQCSILQEYNWEVILAYTIILCSFLRNCQIIFNFPMAGVSYFFNKMSDISSFSVSLPNLLFSFFVCVVDIYESLKFCIFVLFCFDGLLLTLYFEIISGKNWRILRGTGNQTQVSSVQDKHFNFCTSSRFFYYILSFIFIHYLYRAFRDFLVIPACMCMFMYIFYF